MTVIDTSIMKKFLQQASNKLSGKWLLVGGTLLPAVGIDVRPTVDIDLVGLGDKERSQTLELMDMAASFGLAVEVINQAASYFVEKLKPQSKDMISLLKGKTAEIFRPSAELYLRLKAPRLNESDLLDCQHYLQYCKGQQDKMSFDQLITDIQKLLRSENSKDKQERLKTLLALVR